MRIFQNEILGQCLGEVPPCPSVSPTRRKKGTQKKEKVLKLCQTAHTSCAAKTQTQTTRTKDDDNQVLLLPVPPQSSRAPPVHPAISLLQSSHSTTADTSIAKLHAKLNKGQTAARDNFAYKLDSTIPLANLVQDSAPAAASNVEQASLFLPASVQSTYEQSFPPAAENDIQKYMSDLLVRAWNRSIIKGWEMVEETIKKSFGDDQGFQKIQEEMRKTECTNYQSAPITPRMLLNRI